MGRGTEGGSLASVALTLEYFGPNGEPLPNERKVICWNDPTDESEGYGIAIALTNQTPEFSSVCSSSTLLTTVQSIYEQLMVLKHQKLSELKEAKISDSITITSERLNKIQRRISALTLEEIPDNLNVPDIKDTLKKLNAWKELRPVQKLLKEYTDGLKTNLETPIFLNTLIEDVDALNLMTTQLIHQSSLKISLSAILLRTQVFNELKLLSTKS